MAGVEVHQVPEGSIVVLRDVELDGAEMAEAMTEGLAAIAGHNRFVVLTIVDGADVEVWGPDTDVREQLTRLLEEARMGDDQEQPNALTGVPGGAALVPTPKPDDPPSKGRIAVTGTEDEDGDDG